MSVHRLYRLSLLLCVFMCIFDHIWKVQLTYLCDPKNINFIFFTNNISCVKTWQNMDRPTGVLIGQAHYSDNHHTPAFMLWIKNHSIFGFWKCEISNLCVYGTFFSEVETLKNSGPWHGGLRQSRLQA